MSTPAGSWDRIYDPVGGNLPSDEGWTETFAGGGTGTESVSGGQHLWIPDLTTSGGFWDDFFPIAVKDEGAPLAATWRYTFEDLPALDAWPTWQAQIEVDDTDGLWSAFVFGFYHSGLSAWVLADSQGDILDTIASPHGTHEVILVVNMGGAQRWWAGVAGFGSGGDPSYRLVFDGVEYFHPMHQVLGSHEDLAEFTYSGNLADPTTPAVNPAPSVDVTWRTDYFAVADTTVIGV